MAPLRRELIASVIQAALTGYFIQAKEERRYMIPILVSCYGAFFILILPWLGIRFFSRDERFLAVPDPAKDACFLPILFNYLPEGFSIGSYIELCRRIVLLFAYAYLPIVPLAIKGAFRSRLMDLMVIWLLVGGVINPLAFPIASIPYFQRWQTLLVFPFCAYVAKSLSWMIKVTHTSLLGIHRNKVLLLAIPYMIFGILYSSGLVFYESEWFPPNLVQSSIGIDQIDDCIKCVKWLNENAANRSCLIIEERFRGWVLLYMDRKDIKIALYVAPSSEVPTSMSGFERAYYTAVRAGFEIVYLIWYSEETHINRFSEVFKCGNIAVYSYKA